MPQTNNSYLPGWDSLDCYSLLRVGLADWLVSCYDYYSNKFFLSRDGGLTWLLSSDDSSPVGWSTGRTTLSAQAWSSAGGAPQLIYALVANSVNDGYRDIFTSKDLGATWQSLDLQNSV